MVKQKDAVFNAICAVLGATSFSGEVTLTKEERQVVQKSLIADFKAGNIEYTGDVNDSKKLAVYTSGLVSNWLRKDKRLNGNVTYVPKNPGTRTGSSDDSVKAMKALLDQIDDPEQRADIQRELDKRLLELKPRPNIDVDKLPENLRHMVPTQVQ